MRPTQQLATLALLAMGSACDATPLADENSEIPEIIQEAFDRSCSISGCHTSSKLAGGFSLEAGASSAILGGSTPNSTLPLVQIGDLYGSYLALKMLPPGGLPLGTPSVFGAQMPLDLERPNEVALILAWIAGADVSGASLDATVPVPCFAPNLSPGTPTFEEDVFPILANSCSDLTCHGGMSENEMNNLVLEGGPATDWAALMVAGNSYNLMPFVTPYMPDQSYMWHKLSGTQSVPVVGGGGASEPRGGQMCSTDKGTIYRWILQGACFVAPCPPPP